MNPLTTALTALLVKTVFPVIAAIVAAFAVVLMRKISSKLHIKNTAAFDSLATSVAKAGAVMTEEYALSALKHHKFTLTPNDKLNMNIAHIISTIPSIDKATAERYANIAVASLKGLGASGDKVLGK